MAHGTDTDTRKPAVAGVFYPGSAGKLSAMIASFMEKTENKRFGNLKALIVPHAGYVYSGQTAAWGFAQISDTAKRDEAVVIGPSHQFPFEGLAASGASAWETPLGTIKQIKPEKTDLSVVIDDLAFEGEHSVEVELPFLQTIGFRSVTCLLTGMTADTDMVARYLSEYYLSSLIVISSDLSHYLPDEDAREKDKKTIRAILHGDKEYLEHEDNAACGHVGIRILMELASVNHWKSEQIYYDTSRTASGDTAQVVGYGAIVFY